MRRRQQKPLSVQTILWLQTTCGNRAVQRLLARKALERASEQQALVIAAGTQLDIRASGSIVVQNRLMWWRRIIQWFRRQCSG